MSGRLVPAQDQMPLRPGLDRLRLEPAPAGPEQEQGEMSCTDPVLELICVRRDLKCRRPALPLASRYPARYWPVL